MKSIRTFLIAAAIATVSTASADTKSINQEINDIATFDVTYLNESTVRYDSTVKKWVLDLAGIIESYGSFGKFMKENPERVVIALFERSGSGLLPNYNLELNILKIAEETKDVTSFAENTKFGASDASYTAFRTTVVLPTEPFAKATEPIKVTVGFPKGSDSHHPRVDLVYYPGEKKYELHAGVITPKPFGDGFKEKTYVFKKFLVEPKVNGIVDDKVEVLTKPFGYKPWGGAEVVKDLPYFSFNITANLQKCGLGKETTKNEIRVISRYQQNTNFALASVMESTSTASVPVLDPLGESCEPNAEKIVYLIRDGRGFRDHYYPFLKGERPIINQGTLRVAGKLISAYFDEKLQKWKISFF